MKVNIYWSCIYLRRPSGERLKETELVNCCLTEYPREQRSRQSEKTMNLSVQDVRRSEIHVNSWRPAGWEVCLRKQVSFQLETATQTSAN
jgi:hypothetical protein